MWGEAGAQRVTPLQNPAHAPCLRACPFNRHAEMAWPLQPHPEIALADSKEEAMIPALGDSQTERSICWSAQLKQDNLDSCPSEAT